MATAREFGNWLRRRGVAFVEVASTQGVDFKCATGELFRLYQSTGAIRVEGPDTQLARDVRAMGKTYSPLRKLWDSPEEPPAIVPPADRRVFIIYGHDTAARNSLELVLRRLGVEPVVLEQLPAAGDTVIEKLERYLGEHGNVGFACALLTPDDEGHPAGREELTGLRARQNVVLELGMVLGRLGRRRVVIFHKGQLELPSDIAGLIYRSFKVSIEEVQSAL